MGWYKLTGHSGSNGSFDNNQVPVKSTGHSVAEFSSLWGFFDGGAMRFIEDRIKQLQNINRTPTVGPYTVTKTGFTKEGPYEYQVTTEIWELDTAIVRFEFKGSKNNPSGFTSREAKGIGKYLGRDEKANAISKLDFVEVMLVDGLEPTVTEDPDEPNYVVGRASIRCKAVTSSTGDRTHYWLFVKIHPLEGDDLDKKPELQLEISHNIGSRMQHYLRAYGTDYNGMQVGFLPLGK